MLKEESGGSAGSVARGASVGSFPGVTYVKGGDPICSFLHGLILSALRFLLLPGTLLFSSTREIMLGCK